MTDSTGNAIRRIAREQKVRDFAAKHGLIKDGCLALYELDVKFGNIYGFAAAFAESELAAIQRKVVCSFCGTITEYDYTKEHAPQPRCEYIFRDIGTDLRCDKTSGHDGEHHATMGSIKEGIHVEDPAAQEQSVENSTRFQEFDDEAHPCNKWWQDHGQFMMSGGGRRQFIWACRGWIAREQLAEGVEVTGESEPPSSPQKGKP